MSSGFVRIPFARSATYLPSSFFPYHLSLYSSLNSLPSVTKSESVQLVLPCLVLSFPSFFPSFTPSLVSISIPLSSSGKTQLRKFAFVLVTLLAAHYHDYYLLSFTFDDYLLPFFTLSSLVYPFFCFNSIFLFYSFPFLNPRFTHSLLFLYSYSPFTLFLSLLFFTLFFPLQCCFFFVTHSLFSSFTPFLLLPSFLSHVIICFSSLIL